MENKTKKLMAGVGLGVALCTGAVGMAGCSMTDEQKEALDLITNKADQLVEIIEDNYNYNNKVLTKSEACEQLLIARNFFDFGELKQVKAVFNSKSFDGVFDSLLTSSTAEVNYKHSDDQKYLFLNKTNAEGEYERDYLKSDFEANKHYSYHETYNNTPRYSEGGYNLINWDLGRQLDPLAGLGYSADILPEDIKSITILENGYQFDIYVCQAQGDSVRKVNFKFTIKNGKIDKVDFSAVYYSFPENALDAYIDDKDNLLVDVDYLSHMFADSDINVYSQKASITYQYDNIDFAEIDAKFATIEADNAQ